jgi:hypothetical protein
MPIPQNVNNKLSNVVARIKTWFICNFVSYQDSATTYRFIKTNQWTLRPATAAFRGLFTIVHRNDYAEFHRLLPISDVKELKAVLRMDMPEHAKHIISELNQNSRHVTSYAFDEQAVRNIAFYQALLPVSRVIAAGIADEECVIDVSGEQAYFVSKFNGLVSSQKKTPLIHSVDMFCLSSGVGDGVVTVPVTDGELPQRLVSGLLRLSVRDLLHFSFISPVSTLFQFRSFLLVSGLVALFYMSFTSAALHYQHKSIAQQIDLLGPKLDILLDKQQRLFNLEDAVIEVNANAAQNQSMSQLVQLLMDVKANNAAVNDYQAGPNGVAIRGRVSNASEFLLKLRSLNYVVSAEFKAPTVKVENSEEYSIQVVLKRTTSNES